MASESLASFFVKKKEKLHFNSMKDVPRIFQYGQFVNILDRLKEEEKLQFSAPKIKNEAPGVLCWP